MNRKIRITHSFRQSQCNNWSVAVLLPLLSSFSPSGLAETVMVVESDVSASREQAWGPSPTIAAKRSATGSKTDTPVEKIPQSLSVITRQEMDAHQAATVKAALQYTPGVSTTSRGASSTYDHVIIRGFAPNGQNQNNYWDGLKLQGDFYNDPVIDPWMLERIEVLRGPTSVLYGKSSPGGLVSMVSKRPTDEPLREVQFKMGSDALLQTGFDFSNKLNESGTWSYRLTGLAHSNQSMQYNSDQKRYALAPVLSWQPTEQTRFTFLSYLQNEPETGYYGWLSKEGTVQPLPNGKRLPRTFNEGASNNTSSRAERMVGYRAEHDLDSQTTVRQSLRFSELKTAQNTVYGMGICNAASCPTVAPTDRNHTLVRKTITDSERLQNLAVDTQLDKKLTIGRVQHQVLVGVDFQRMRNDINATFGDASPRDLYSSAQTDWSFSAPQPYQMNTMQQAGLYIQDQAQWQQWFVTLGGRYDWLAQDSLLRRADNTTVGRADRQFSWRGGVNYLFNNGMTPYFSYSQSFEPNDFDLFDTPPVTFTPSRGEQYEMGLKYVPQHRPVVLTGALYNLTKSHTLTGDPHNPLRQVAAGTLQARGIELEAKLALNWQTNLTAAYTYTQVRYTKDATLQGNTPAQVPTQMASLWGDYTLYSGPLTGTTLGMGGRYAGASMGDPANTFKVGSSTVLDALIKYDLGQVGLTGSSMALNITNLLNRQYVASCFQTYGCFWGAGRQLIVTASFRF